jgi:hypothetical protein
VLSARSRVHRLPAGEAVWRVAIALIGLVIVVGVILLPLPGPGWLLVFLGIRYVGHGVCLRADRSQDVCLIGTGRTPLRNGGQRLHARLEDGVHMHLHLHVRAVEALRPLEVSDRVWHRPGP